MDVLVLKWKLGMCCIGRELMLLFPKEKLWIPSKLIKIRFDGGKNLLKILTTDMKKITMKNYKADDVYADPST